MTNNVAVRIVNNVGAIIGIEEILAEGSRRFNLNNLNPGVHHFEVYVYADPHYGTYVVRTEGTLAKLPAPVSASLCEIEITQQPGAEKEIKFDNCQFLQSRISELR